MILASPLEGIMQNNNFLSKLRDIYNFTSDEIVIFEKFQRLITARYPTKIKRDDDFAALFSSKDAASLTTALKEPLEDIVQFLHLSERYLLMKTANTVYDRMYSNDLSLNS